MTLEIAKSTCGCCPYCGRQEKYKYEFKGFEYPIYMNDKKFVANNGPYYDWDEVYSCQNCDTSYYIHRMNLLKSLNLN